MLRTSFVSEWIKLDFSLSFSSRRPGRFLRISKYSLVDSVGLSENEAKREQEEGCEMHHPAIVAKCLENGKIAFEVKREARWENQRNSVGGLLRKQRDTVGSTVIN